MKHLLFAFAAAAFLGVAQAQVPSYVPTDGLVAWYPFNGDAHDESGNGNDGEVSGATIAEDHFGGQSAFYFNGDGDQINIPYSASLSPTEQVSVSAWCKPETLEGKNLVSNGTHVNYFQRSYYIFGPNESGQCRFRINAGGVEDNVYSSGSFGTSEWIHVIGTYDGTQMKLYVNGQLEGSLAKSGSINQHGNGTTIGGNIFYAWSDYWFQGSIDDVGVWNRALTNEEIELLYSTDFETGCTDWNACNFDAAATLDDGLCEYGCNYCGPGTSWDAVAQICVVATPAYLNEPGETAVLNPCYFDTNYDGLVEVTDLMNVLSVYGLACGDVSYSVGDTGPSGGLVFFVDENDVYPGWTYLEAAPEDIDLQLTWGNWYPGSEISSLYSTLGNEIGEGLTNSERIWFVLDSLGDDGNNPAALACREYEAGNLNDWFLGSLGEMELLRSFAQSTSDSTFVLQPSDTTVSEYWQQFQTGYWSSSLMDNYAGAVSLFFLNQGNCGCAFFESYWVRPIRRF